MPHLKRSNSKRATSQLLRLRKLRLPCKIADEKEAIIAATKIGEEATNLEANKMGGVISTEEKWMQDVVSQLAPSVSQFASNAVVKGTVEPAVRRSLKRAGGNEGDGGAKLSDAAANFRFTSLDFGTMPPRVTNLGVHRTEGDDKSVVIDFDLEYLGDSSLQVSLMGIHSGVRDLNVCGRARVTLKPTTSSNPPFFGGVQFCFLNEIDIDFDLEGLADICDWSFIKRKIRRGIVEDASKKCVYPNKVVIPTSSMDPMQIKCFDPKVMVGLKIISGTGLPKKGGLRSLVGQGKPDTYVVVRLGSTAFITQVIKNSTNPVWDSEDWFDFLLERHQGHTVKLMAYDHDSFSKDDFLGTVLINLQDHMDALLDEAEVAELTFPLEDDIKENKTRNQVQVSGELTVALRWLPLKSFHDLESEPRMAVLTLFVYSCNNLVELADGSSMAGEEEGVPGAVIVKASVGNFPCQQTEVIRNNQHPNFQHGFTFHLKQLNDWINLTAYLSTLENSTGSSFGKLELNLGEISSNPIKRKVFSLNEEKPMITITLSANLKFA